jgi:hypothetical protein
MYRAIVARIIADIKALPESSRASGDDSPYRDVWEEFKVQIQGEHSICFDAYEDTIRAMCSHTLRELDRDQQCFLWLWCEGYLDEWVAKDAIQLEDEFPEHVVDELYQRVVETADNEPMLHELEDDIHGGFPKDWPEQQFVDLEQIPYTREWIEEAIGKRVPALLFNLSQHEDKLSDKLAAAYLALDAGAPLVSILDETVVVAPENALATLKSEFVTFLRNWRENVQEPLQKWHQIRGKP